MALPTVGAVFGVFRIFCQNFVCRKHGPGRMSGSSQTYLFNSNYNIDLSAMFIRLFKHMRFC